jgi:hypothetical protein
VAASQEHIRDSIRWGELPDADLGPAPCWARSADVTTELCRQSIDRPSTQLLELDRYLDVEREALAAVATRGGPVERKKW